MKREMIFESHAIKAQIKQGLLHYYNFENNAVDSVGGVNGNVSSVSFGDTNGVNVAKFNGISSKIEFPSPIMVQGNGIRSVNVWLKPNSIHSTYGNSFGIFGNTGSYTGFSIHLYKSTQFYLWHGTGDVGRNIDVTGLNMWTYLFMGGSVTNTKLYKNGIYVGNLGIVAGTNGNMNTQPIYNLLGYKPKLASWDQPGGYYFDGDIGYLGVWNRLLTDEEITALYNKGKGLRI